MSDSLQPNSPSSNEIARMEGIPLLQLTIPSSSSFISAILSSDGGKLASGWNDNSISLNDASTGVKTAELRGHQRPVSSLSFSPDGKRIISGLNDGTLRIWDVKSGSSIATLLGHTNEVSSVVYSQSGKRIASGSKDNTIRIWNAITFAVFAILRGHTQGINSLAFSPNGAEVASGSSDRSTRIWQVPKKSLASVLSGHTDIVSCVVYTPDAKRIVSGSHDRTISLWDATSRVKIGDLTGHEERVNSIACSPDSQRIISASDDRTVRVWDMNSRASIAVIKVQNIVESVTFSSDGKSGFTTREARDIEIWGIVDTGARDEKWKTAREWMEEKVKEGEYTYNELFWALSKVRLQNPSTMDAVKQDFESSMLLALESKPQEPTPIVDVPPRFFALLIGINKYKNPKVPALKGAVNDADSVKEFLEKDLKIPSSRIRNLRDSKATRAAIIQALRDLRKDPDITPGDPIMIFYAGHGGETSAPSKWDTGGEKVQMLIPYDFCTNSSDGEVHGIPDRTLGALLKDLSKQKGENITVIFDCSHSSSNIWPVESDSTCLARAVEVPNNVPDNLDQDIWRRDGDEELGMDILAGFFCKEQRSHVLLAACGETETAKEERERGVFTKALLRAIAIAGADQITYADLFQRIPELPEQSPQCKGDNTNHLLFDSKAPSPKRVLHKVHMDGGKYVLSAGAVHGITNGAEFVVYPDETVPPTAPRLGTLEVLESLAFSSNVKFHPDSDQFSLTQPAFALQTKAGVKTALRLYVAPEPQLTDLFKKLVEYIEHKGSDRRRVVPTEQGQSELEIGLEDGRIVFNFVNPIVTQEVTRMPYSIRLSDIDDIFSVIRAAAHYSWHLHRSAETKVFQSSVHIEVWKLIKDPSGEIKPTGENLNRGGVVRLVVEKDAMYGIKLINNSARDLYPWLFYFDSSNFSIGTYYQPSTAGNFKLDVPLPQDKSLTIGWGPGGAAPLTYFIEPGHDKEVGFLKLFVATEPVDHSDIPQDSPFKARHRGAEAVVPKKKPIWNTILVAVVLERG